MDTATALHTDPATGIRTGTVTRETATGIMYRCRKCKAARRVDVPTTVTTTYYRRRNVQGFEHQGQDTRRREAWHQPPACCGQQMRGQNIRGTYVEDVPCGAKCVNAVGPSCDCSCGGKNHGRGHSH